MSREETAEERAAEEASYQDFTINYLAEQSGVDRRDVAGAYAEDKKGLSHHYNMMSNGRRLRGWGIAGIVLFGALSAGGVAYSIKNDNLGDLPFFSLPLAALSVLGVRSGQKKNDTVVELVKTRVAKQTPSP